MKNIPQINEIQTMDTRSEFIICPKCDRIQKATIQETNFWDIYIHHCECGYIIEESEWLKTGETE